MRFLYQRNSDSGHTYGHFNLLVPKTDESENKKVKDMVFVDRFPPGGRTSSIANMKKFFERWSGAKDPLPKDFPPLPPPDGPPSSIPEAIMQQQEHSQAVEIDRNKQQEAEQQQKTLPAEAPSVEAIMQLPEPSQAVEIDSNKQQEAEQQQKTLPAEAPSVEAIMQQQEPSQAVEIDTNKQQEAEQQQKTLPAEAPSVEAITQHPEPSQAVEIDSNKQQEAMQQQEAMKAETPAVEAIIQHPEPSQAVEIDNKQQEAVQPQEAMKAETPAVEAIMQHPEPSQAVEIDNKQQEAVQPQEAMKAETPAVEAIMQHPEPSQAVEIDNKQQEAVQPQEAMQAETPAVEAIMQHPEPSQAVEIDNKQQEAVQPQEAMKADNHSSLHDSQRTEETTKLEGSEQPDNDTQDSNNSSYDSAYDKIKYVVEKIQSFKPDPDRISNVQDDFSDSEEHSQDEANDEYDEANDEASSEAADKANDQTHDEAHEQSASAAKANNSKTCDDNADSVPVIRLSEQDINKVFSDLDKSHEIFMLWTNKNITGKVYVTAWKSANIVGTVYIHRQKIVKTFADLRGCECFKDASREIRELWKNRLLKEEKRLYVWEIKGIEKLEHPKRVIGHEKKRFFNVILQKMISFEHRDAPAMTLESSAKYFLDNLSTDDLQRLESTMKHLDQCTIRVGTTCSGTDIAVSMIRSTFSVLSKHFGASCIGLILYGNFGKCMCTYKHCGIVKRYIYIYMYVCTYKCNVYGTVFKYIYMYLFTFKYCCTHTCMHVMFSVWVYFMILCFFAFVLKTPFVAKTTKINR